MSVTKADAAREDVAIQTALARYRETTAGLEVRRHHAAFAKLRRAARAFHAALDGIESEVDRARLLSTMTTVVNGLATRDARYPISLTQLKVEAAHVEAACAIELDVRWRDRTWIWGVIACATWWEQMATPPRASERGRFMRALQRLHDTRAAPAGLPMLTRKRLRDIVPLVARDFASKDGPR